MGQYSIGDAINNFLKTSRIKGSIQALRIEEVWETIMGKTVAKYTDKIYIIDRTLFINTHVAPLRNELVYQKDIILKRVNEALGNDDIKEVVIQ